MSATPALSCFVRVCAGSLLREVLALPAIARVDRPPIPDLGERDPAIVTLADMPEPADPEENAPLIGIVDSGSTEHPLLGTVIDGVHWRPGELWAPPMIGATALRLRASRAFGDLRECVSTNTFASPVRIVSAKVVNDQGQFDDTATIPVANAGRNPRSP